MNSAEKKELQEIIRDFSHHLAYRRQNGPPLAPLSGAARRTLDGWGSAKSADIPFTGRGDENSPLFIVDGEGCFFAGKPGELLGRMLEGMGLSKDRVYICNAPDAARIEKKIRAAGPVAVLTLGARAARMTLDDETPFSRLISRFHRRSGTRVMPTLHPGFLLKRPEMKRQVWEDLKQVMACLGKDHGH